MQFGEALALFAMVWIEAIRLVHDMSRAMTSSTQHVAPLRQHMIDDMWSRQRKLTDKTQSGYLRFAERFAEWMKS